MKSPPAEGHTLRQVVQGDREDENTDTAAAFVSRTARPGLVAFMRRQFFQSGHPQHAQCHAGYYDLGADRLAAAKCGTGFHAGQHRADRLSPAFWLRAIVQPASVVSFFVMFFLLLGLDCRAFHGGDAPKVIDGASGADRDAS